MGTLPDTELQPILSREIIEVDEKIRSVEENLRSADVAEKVAHRIARRGETLRKGRPRR
jgi:hypothetical protein